MSAESDKPRLIRISSRALGDRAHVRVYVYPDLETMRAAAQKFNGEDHPDSVGICQALCDEKFVITTPIVRIAEGHLGSQVVSHELHHAATGLYGASLRRAGELADLSNSNEPFAHLYSDLFTSLVNALYGHGYYE